MRKSFRFDTFPASSVFSVKTILRPKLYTDFTRPWWNRRQGCATIKIYWAAMTSRCEEASRERCAQHAAQGKPWKKKAAKRNGSTGYISGGGVFPDAACAARIAYDLFAEHCLCGRQRRRCAGRADPAGDGGPGAGRDFVLPASLASARSLVENGPWLYGGDPGLCGAWVCDGARRCTRPAHARPAGPSPTWNGSGST